MTSSENPIKYHFLWVCQKRDSTFPMHSVGIIILLLGSKVNHIACTAIISILMNKNEDTTAFSTTTG